MAGSSTATFWQWVEALNGGIKDIRVGGNAETTYRDIVRHLYPAASHTTEIGAVSYLIFATICCVTAVGRPTINPPPSNNRATALGMQIHGAQFRVPVETSIDSLVSNSFVDSQRLTQADPCRTPGNNAVHPDNLDLSVVDLCKTWSIYLRFDPTAGELSIFAWPSICLATLAGRAENGTGVALASLLAERLRGSASDPTIFEEVLLSMRLLFARSKKSRDMFLKRVGQEEQPVDPFWGECVSPINAGNAQTSSRSRFPPVFIRCSESMRYFNNAYFADYALDPELWNRLQDSRACSAAAVFPVFADRLTTLQVFINPQSVDGFWELVRGRRNWAETVKFRVSLAAIALTVIEIVIPLVVTKATK
ncbi:hypothetical protein ASPVEDRAFT_154670 [Aspergillus versicolor CBS 583.65]|uniref:Uncharacterized protein n=1 Tax=Aspergillus versicolor CBS 583.65 TaxID=1036611 RepID=A0A1L9PZ17_ASPVE|nr:uncharacterized protein ASPVEDRAFT_154670 [Aspergillus versicolor CBS 583.65]OJJ06682.1 hypothetical protein ASPVEDRAFT_154670 [Aspergillus versicolor CBS 583.65]